MPVENRGWVGKQREAIRIFKRFGPRIGPAFPSHLCESVIRRLKEIFGITMFRRPRDFSILPRHGHGIGGILRPERMVSNDASHVWSECPKPGFGQGIASGIPCGSGSSPPSVPETGDIFSRRSVPQSAACKSRAADRIVDLYQPISTARFGQDRCKVLEKGILAIDGEAGQSPQSGIGAQLPTTRSEFEGSMRSEWSISVPFLHQLP